MFFWLDCIWISSKGSLRLTPHSPPPKGNRQMNHDIGGSDALYFNAAVALGVLVSFLVLSHDEHVASASRTLFSGLFTLLVLIASAAWGLYSMLHCTLVGFIFTPFSLGAHWISLIAILCLASESISKIVFNSIGWCLKLLTHAMLKRFNKTS